MTTRRSFLKLLGLISAGAVLPKNAGQEEAPKPAYPTSVQSKLASVPRTDGLGYITMKTNDGAKYRIPVFDYL